MRPFWQLEGAELWHGDARRLDALNDDSVDLIVTSPPYWNARPEYASWPTYDAYLADMSLVWAECYRVLVNGGRRLIGADTARTLEAAGFELRGEVIWDKRPSERALTSWGSWRSATNPSLRDAHEIVILAHKNRAWRDGPAEIEAERFMRLTSSIWTITPARSAWHPAPFPAELAARLIELLSFAGDVVLDLFAGTGTTIWTAARLGRRGIGVELSENYLTRAVAEHDAPLLRLANDDDQVEDAQRDLTLGVNEP